MTIKGIVNLYFFMKKLPSVKCNNTVGDSMYSMTLLFERNLYVYLCIRGFRRTRLNHWERLSFVLSLQCPYTVFILRSKATSPVVPDCLSPSVPPSFPLFRPPVLTSGAFRPRAWRQPENLTLILFVLDLSRTFSWWRFLASLNLPPPLSGGAVMGSTGSKHSSSTSYVPGSVLAHCCSQQLCEGGTIITHILQVRKLGHREAK